MKAIDELKKLSEELDDLSQQINSLHKKQGVIQAKISTARARVVSEENILFGSEWSIVGTIESRPDLSILVGNLAITEKLIENLMLEDFSGELTEKFIYIEDEVYLFLPKHSPCVELHLDISYEKIKEFIKKHNLNISSSIKEKIEELQGLEKIISEIFK